MFIIEAAGTACPESMGDMPQTSWSSIYLTQPAIIPRVPGRNPLRQPERYARGLADLQMPTNAAFTGSSRS